MGEDVYVVGGGFSLKGFNFNRLRDKNVIAVNKALLDVPFAQYFVTLDERFFRMMRADKILYKYLMSSATKVFIAQLWIDFMEDKKGVIRSNKHNLIFDLSLYDVIIKSKSNKGAGLTFKEFVTGENSGLAGLQLAVCLNHKPKRKLNIYLLGMDLVIQGNETHFHGGYGPSAVKQIQRDIHKYRDAFIDFIQDLKKKAPNVNVYSCSSISPLNDLIPYKPLDKIK